MPYSSNSELPPEIRNNLPDPAQSTYRVAYNSANARGKDEQEADAIAWTAVERSGWKKVNGRWIKVGKSIDEVITNLTNMMKQSQDNMNNQLREVTELAKVKQNDQFIPVLKNEELGIVSGWFNVSTQNGQPYFDDEDSHIPTLQLQKAAHKFISKIRSPGGEMHETNADGSVKEVGRVVDSIVFTDELQKMLGINLGQEGWFGSIQIDKENYPDVWNKIKLGEYSGFSIGGRAMVEAV